MKAARLSTLTGGLYRPGETLVLISVRGWSDPKTTVRPEGLSQWKISNTPSGIETATFRPVVQRPNQLRYQTNSIRKPLHSFANDTPENQTATSFAKGVLVSVCAQKAWQYPPCTWQLSLSRLTQATGGTAQSSAEEKVIPHFYTSY